MDTILLIYLFGCVTSLLLYIKIEQSFVNPFWKTKPTEKYQLFRIFDVFLCVIFSWIGVLLIMSRG